MCPCHSMRFSANEAQIQAPHKAGIRSNRLPRLLVPHVISSQSAQLFVEIGRRRDAAAGSPLRRSSRSALTWPGADGIGTFVTFPSDRLHFPGLVFALLGAGEQNHVRSDTKMQGETTIRRILFTAILAAATLWSGSFGFAASKLSPQDPVQQRQRLARMPARPHQPKTLHLSIGSSARDSNSPSGIRRRHGPALRRLARARWWFLHRLDPPATVLSMAEWNWASSLRGQSFRCRSFVDGGTERLPNPSTQRLSLQDASPLLRKVRHCATRATQDGRLPMSRGGLLRPVLSAHAGPSLAMSRPPFTSC